MKKITLILLIALSPNVLSAVGKQPIREPSSIDLNIPEPELAMFAPEIIEAQKEKLSDTNPRRSKFWHEEVLEKIKELKD